MALEVSNVQQSIPITSQKKTGIAKNLLVAGACLLGGAGMTGLDHVDSMAAIKAIPKGVKAGQYYAENQNPRNYRAWEWTGREWGPGTLFGTVFGFGGALTALILAEDKKNIQQK